MSGAAEFSLCFEDILKKDLKKYVGKLNKIEEGGDLHALVMTIVEKSLLEVALSETEGNQTRASHILGVNRNTLRRKIQEHHLSLDDFARGKGSNGHR